MVFLSHVLFVPYIFKCSRFRLYFGRKVITWPSNDCKILSKHFDKLFFRNYQLYKHQAQYELILLVYFGFCILKFSNSINDLLEIESE